MAIRVNLRVAPLWGPPAAAEEDGGASSILVHSSAEPGGGSNGAWCGPCRNFSKIHRSSSALSTGNPSASTWPNRGICGAVEGKGGGRKWQVEGAIRASWITPAAGCPSPLAPSSPIRAPEGRLRHSLAPGFFLLDRTRCAWSFLPPSESSAWGSGHRRRFCCWWLSPRPLSPAICLGQRPRIPTGPPSAPLTPSCSEKGLISSSRSSTSNANPLRCVLRLFPSHFAARLGLVRLHFFLWLWGPATSRGGDDWLHGALPGTVWLRLPPWNYRKTWSGLQILALNPALCSSLSLGKLPNCLFFPLPFLILPPPPASCQFSAAIEFTVLLDSGLQVRRRPCIVASLSERGEYHSQRPPTPLLDTINYPIHMKNLSLKVNFSMPRSILSAGIRGEGKLRLIIFFPTFFFFVWPWKGAETARRWAALRRHLQRIKNGWPPGLEPRRCGANCGPSLCLQHSTGQDPVGCGAPGPLFSSPPPPPSSPVFIILFFYYD